MTNRNLLQLNVKSDDDMAGGNMLEVLGLNCPLLQTCILSFHKITSDVTDTQIEVFTKGCQYLKSLHLDFEKSKNERVADKLLWYLGNYNPLLEELEVSSLYKSIKFCTIECIKVFTMGCTLLRKIDFHNIKLSTQSVNHIINNVNLLEELNLYYCRICKDGLIVTKDRGKLQHLKYLDLSYNHNLTDESFINIIKGCRNLETILIYHCIKLTDASLFSIAANCPNLEEHFKESNKSFTNIGYNELKTKCLQLDFTNKMKCT